MMLGGLPRLMLDRTGVALLGAIAIIGLREMTPEEAARAVHLPTMLLLFSFMVISAQMRLGGFYSAVTRRIAALRVGPGGLLAVVIFVAGALSAVFSNDIVCLAVAPVLAEACLRRRLDPVPYLLALACASNIGSAATLIGNPQNMLIGEVLQLSFAGYAREALLPVRAGPAGAVGGAGLAGAPRRAAGRPRGHAARRDDRRGAALRRLADLQGPVRRARRWWPSSCSPTGRATWRRWWPPACCC